MAESSTSSERTSHSDLTSAGGVSGGSSTVELQPVVSMDFTRLSPTESSKFIDKVELSPLLFSLVIFTELFTTAIVILLILLRDCPTCTIVGGLLSVHLVFILSVAVRVTFWVYISVRLAGRRFWRAYIIIDNLAAMVVLASMAYGALNFAVIRAGHIEAGFGVAFFFIMLFTLTGHFRNLMIYMKWTRTKLVLYKVERIFAAMYYMGLGLHTVRMVVLVVPK
jgi:hypothetical protein